MILPVKSPVLYRFADMRRQNVFTAFYVGNCSCHFEYARRAACAQIEFFKRLLQKSLAIFVDHAIFVEFFRTHFGVCEYAVFFKSLALNSTHAVDTLFYLRARLAALLKAQFVVRDIVHFDLQIYSVHQRTAEF